MSKIEPQLSVVTKIRSGFLIVAMFVLIQGFISTQMSSNALLDRFRSGTEEQVKQTLFHVDVYLQRRIESLRTITALPRIHDELITSNARADLLENPDANIARIDTAWTAAQHREEQIPEMTSILQHDESRGLAAYVQKFIAINGFPVISEIFFTNAHGEVVLASNATSDYMQADEDWWSKAREEEVFYSDIEYDQSSQSYAVPIAMRVEDAQNNFIGIMRAYIDIRSIQSILSNLDEMEHGFLLLLDGEGEVLYPDSSTISNADRIAAHHLFREIPASNHSVGSFTSSYHIHSNEDHVHTIAYAHSTGYKDFPGIHWTLLAGWDRDWILKPMMNIRMLSYLMTAVTVAFSLMIGLGIARSIESES